MSAIDMTEILKPYSGKWVAKIDNKKVVSSGDTIEEVERKIKERNLKNFSYMFVLPFDKGFSGIL